MLNRLVQTVSLTVGRRARRFGHAARSLLRRTRSVAMLVAAASVEAVRPRSS